MKNSIKSTGWQYSTSRMLMDYLTKMYIPLCNLYNRYYSDLENVIRMNEWIDSIKTRWDKIKIKQLENLNNVIIDAGNNIEVKCKVDLQNIDKKNVSVQVYSGKVLENGILEDIQIKEMQEQEKESDIYKAKISLQTGGDYGYTFRIMPKHEMILEAQNLNLVKWMTDEMQKEEKNEIKDIEKKTEEEAKTIDKVADEFNEEQKDIENTIEENRTEN
ncbi:MAG: glycosyltransferase family 1 protein [Clostridia bacterium]|jgi:starch phosphorylase|nr:glycosyltransferase family 1 protein [Clostridia bacterium]